MRVKIEDYETSNGSIVVYGIAGKKCETLNIYEINRILSKPLKFGDRMQIHALKSWAVIEEYKRKEREFYR